MGFSKSSQHYVTVMSPGKVGGVVPQMAIYWYTYISYDMLTYNVISRTTSYHMIKFLYNCIRKYRGLGFRAFQVYFKIVSLGPVLH